MEDLGPHRDHRDAVIEKLREELLEAAETNSKLARLAAKKTSPPLPVMARWWMLPLGVGGMLLAPMAVLGALIGMAAGLKQVFRYVIGGTDQGGAWVAAVMLTVGCALIGGPAAWVFVTAWLKARDKAAR
jgi:hypothetical protein